MEQTKGLNKNATRMLTGFIMGTITMGCIMLGGIPEHYSVITVFSYSNIFCIKRVCENS